MIRALVINLLKDAFVKKKKKKEKKIYIDFSLRESQVSNYCSSARWKM
jgi:hypothetical protein